MKLKTAIRFVLAIVFAAFPLAAQVSINTNLTTGTMTSGAANLYRSAYLHFQLVNCGDNVPVMPNQPNAVVQDSFDLRPSTPGSAIVGQIVGNDQITCGNVVSTYYEVTAMKDASHPLRDGIPYVICSASASITTCGNGNSLGTFNIVTADPMSQPPPVPGFAEIYGNPSNNQTISQPSGTEFNFLGAYIFNQGIFAGPVQFGQLSSLIGLSNLVYVSDATAGSSPCTGGGSGSFAFNVNGVWQCSLGGGGGGGGSSTFTGTPNSLPKFSSTTNGVNSCLADSNNDTTGSILNTCTSEGLNIASFQSLTWPSLVTLNTVTATTANVGTLNITNFNLTGPAVITSPAAVSNPANPQTGYSSLALLASGCWGSYSVGGTGYFCFPQEYGSLAVGGNVSASGTGMIYGDSSYFSATAPGFTGSDNGVSILNAENANATYSPDVDARGFQGLWTTASASIMSLFSQTWQGSLELGPAQIRPTVGIGVPRKTILHGAGWQTGSGQPYVGATVFQATNIPTNTPLLGVTGDNVTFNFNNGPVFDSPIDEITSDCASVLGCSAYINTSGQEGTGLFRSNLLGFGNHGKGMVIGGYDVPVTPGTPNNVYGQAVSCNASTCTISLANPQVAGDLIAICARWTPYTVTLQSAANSGNHDTYIPIPNTATVDGTTQGGGCVYDNNVNAGAGTITLTFSGTVNNNTLYVAAIEEPNVRSVDIAAGAVNTTHGPGPTVTTTNVDQYNPDDFIVGMAVTATNSGSWAAGSGFTSGKATGQVGVEYQTQTTTGNYPTTWVSSNTSRTFFFTIAMASGTNNGPGAQNSWYDGIDMSLGTGTTITTDAKCLDINTGGGSGPKELSNFTCTAQGASNPPNELNTVASSGITFRNHHAENAGVAAWMVGEDGAGHSLSFININGGNMNVALSFTITGASETGNTATYTTSSSCAGLNAGQPITITGLTTTGYNQTSSQAVPFVVASSCTGTSFTANLTASGLSTIGGQTGTVTVQNALFAFSANHSNGTGGNCIQNLYAAGPNYPALLLNDEVNGNYISALQEPYLSLYCTGEGGSVTPGSGAGEGVVTSSGQVFSHVWAFDADLVKDVYVPACRYGDCQAGSANQYIARTGYFTIPQGMTQITVSSYAVQDPFTHVQFQDAAANCNSPTNVFGGFPSSCNTTGFFEFKLIGLQPAVNPYPLNGLTPYGPTTALTGCSFSSGSSLVTCTLANTTGFAAGNIVRISGSSVSTGGPFNTGYNVLGLLTSVVSNTSIAFTLQYGSSIATCSSSCGTVQIWPGFTVAVQTTPSTADLAVGFTIVD